MAGWTVKDDRQTWKGEFAADEFYGDGSKLTGLTDTDTLQIVTDRGSVTTNTITTAGVATAGTVSCANLTTTGTGTVSCASLTVSKALIVLPSGNVGIGTTNPTQKFQINGTDSSSSNASILQITTSADAYPLIAMHTYTHDNMSIYFDAYWDGSRRSSDAGSNYAISKNADLLIFEYGSGNAVGNAAGYTIGMRMNTSGNFSFGNIDPDANYKITTTAGGIKAGNNNATNPAGYFNNDGGGPSLITSTGNVGIGITAPATNNRLSVSGGHLFMANSLIDPTTPALGGSITVSGGRLYYKGSAGTLTELAPA